MDRDGGGSVDLAEFKQASESLGYTGTVDALFQILDSDGEGSLSIDEIKRLDRWKPSPILLVQGRPDVLEHVKDVLYEAQEDEPLRAWIASLDPQKSMFL